MIYKFKSQATGDVIMMGPAGDAVLRIIGKEPAASGIIAVAAMPAAIAAIEQAVAADEAAGKPSAKAGADAGDDDRDAGGRGGGGVSLRQRAWPLVDMMKRSQAGNADIVWGVSDAAAADAADDPQSTRVFAIRHGETAWNAESRIQGQLDIPLNQRGRWQAQRLAAALAGEGIDAIYASDLQRAHDTAASLAAACGRRIVDDSGLRERAFGAFEGFTFDEIAARWPAESARWRRREPDFEPAGGESLNAFFARAVGAASRLAVAHRGQTIALVAHGGVLDCLYRAATGLELQAPRTWQIGNAGINRLLHTGKRFTLVGWADLLHLDETAPAPAGEPPGG